MYRTPDERRVNSTHPTNIKFNVVKLCATLLYCSPLCFFSFTHSSTSGYSTNQIPLFTNQTTASWILNPDLPLSVSAAAKLMVFNTNAQGGFASYYYKFIIWCFTWNLPFLTRHNQTSGFLNNIWLSYWFISTWKNLVQLRGSVIHFMKN